MQSFLPSADAAAARTELRQRILSLCSPASANGFLPVALDTFRYQSTNNLVYQTYLKHLHVRADQVTDLRQIPFMPISFFKQHIVRTGQLPSLTTFASSGTTGAQTSRHYVADTDLYDDISQRIFEQVYGSLSNFHILALLPSYLERNNSSLVYMVQQFMRKTNSDYSGFYLDNLDTLTEHLRHLATLNDGRKVLLIGVTFGLLDWAESDRDLSFLKDLPNLIVMETGGMKGRRREMLREEVHDILTNRLGVSTIHSEYGMTELISQAYSPGNGVFYCSPTLRILLRDINDPFCIYPDDYSRTGGINVIDLGNLDSCSFIETQDLGQYVNETPDAFRVIGRFDNSDIRGCNLLTL